MQKFSSKPIFEGWGASGRRLQCVDCHAGGEPARVVLGGLPAIPGRSMVEKRLRMMESDFDAFRKLLLLEPRGYPCQNANFVIPPTGCHPTAAYGVIIAEQGHVYPAMSGHNLMCVATALLEAGMVRMFEPSTDFDLETPAGLVSVSADCKHGKVVQVTLRNVASFCRPEDMDIEIDVPELGKVTLDVAYGGMFYAIVDASTLGLQLLSKHGREICRLGEMIKTACREQHPVKHPEFDYPGCDILVFTENQRSGTTRLCGKNAVVMSNGRLSWDRPETWTGMLDRSPCGTGTSAVMAQLHARSISFPSEVKSKQKRYSYQYFGAGRAEEDFVHESIVGTHFTGRAWITQYCDVVCDPSDPFPEGYVVGDIWPPDIEGPVRKRRAGRSGAASLPAKRRRTTTSTLRWASSLASKRADAVSASAAPAPTFSFTSHVHGKVPTNDDGFMIRLGTQDGFRGRWYCGRILDPSDIPGASEQCGPEGGPQCHSCARYQATYEPDLNDDGYPVKRSLNTKSCFLFYCGRSGVVAGTGGKCAGEGPQCPSCQRLQQSFKAGHVNDEGCIVMLGTTKGYTGLFYCGRVLGVRVIPDSDGRCGPSDGPQCPSCKRYQKSQQVVIDEDEPKPSETPHAPAPPEAQRPVQAPLAKVKRELPDQQTAPPAPPAPPAPAEAPRARADTRPTSQVKDKPQAPAEDMRRSGKEPNKGRQSTRQEAVPDLPQPKRIVCSVCERSDHPDRN
ncbi:unnamed protein product [Symbiodinium sp. CCMP2592]|nr:unnamed protein product [Symbiodinium sp. CCMP2592]